MNNLNYDLHPFLCPSRCNSQVTRIHLAIYYLKKNVFGTNVIVRNEARIPMYIFSAYLADFDKVKRNDTPAFCATGT
jgi:hypothetical protein